MQWSCVVDISRFDIGLALKEELNDFDEVFAWCEVQSSALSIWIFIDSGTIIQKDVRRIEITIVGSMMQGCPAIGI